MKKLVKLLSIMPLLFAMVLIVTSCENEHQHSYAMKCNETKHWKECECGEKSEEGSHNFGNWNTTKEPTVSATGTKERECSVCQYKETETIPVLKHDTHSYTTTKSNETKHWKECECGEKSEEENHTFGDWTTTKEATSTTTGLKERECSVCQYKETETIPVLKHDTHSYTTTKYNETKHWKECSCGEKSEEENHTFGDWTTTQEATSTTTGLKERECSVCHYKETESIPVNSHTHSYTTTKYNEAKHWKECSCGEKSQEESHTLGNWETVKEASYIESGQKKRVCTKCEYEETEDIPVKEITDITTFLEENNDIIVENLKPLYLESLKENYTKEDEVISYRWDLGEVIDGKVTSMKLLLNYNISNTSSFIDVIDVKPKNEINIIGLLDKNKTSSSLSVTYSNVYSFNYISTKQHDRDELIEAILKVAVTDGFKYEMKDVLYTENNQSTDPELGTIRNFKIIISNENGIRDMLVRISNATSDSALINYINNGKYRVSEYNKIYDYINQLKEVDLTAPTDPNTIEYLIYHHNDEITANLETQYQRVLKSAFGRAYGTDRYNALNYRWDLGEVTDGKIQNLKITLTYYDNNAATNTLRVYDVKLNEAIEIKTLLDATAMASIKTTITAPTYTYTYNPTKQHDRDELIEAILKVTITDGFKYEMKDVLYTENTQSTDPDLGTIRRFTVVISNENGIREIHVSIKNTTTDRVLIEYIGTGNYKVGVSKTLDFSNNQLKEVDLTVE